MNPLSGLFVLVGKYVAAGNAVRLFDEAMAFHRAGKFKEAAPLMQEAAESGYINAAAIYGSMLLLGQGVAEDGREAVKWLEHATEAGHEGAKSTLAMALVTGKGGAPRDLKRGVMLLTECAEAGDEQSQRMLEVVSARRR
ncbi:MAG: Sel1 repeat protein [Betaproteobacteria bacterium ADurb.Bin341]|nr:MAG: Sel1 repeat protein [Betaproteobacteria bacterium ADurb.Bin341]